MVTSNSLDDDTITAILEFVSHLTLDYLQSDDLDIPANILPDVEVNEFPRSKDQICVGYLDEKTFHFRDGIHADYLDYEGNPKVFVYVFAKTNKAKKEESNEDEVRLVKICYYAINKNKGGIMKETVIGGGETETTWIDAKLSYKEIFKGPIARRSYPQIAKNSKQGWSDWMTAVWLFKTNEAFPTLANAGVKKSLSKAQAKHADSPAKPFRSKVIIKRKSDDMVDDVDDDQLAQPPKAPKKRKKALNPNPLDWKSWNKKQAVKYLQRVKNATEEHKCAPTDCEALRFCLNKVMGNGGDPQTDEYRLAADVGQMMMGWKAHPGERIDWPKPWV